MSENVLDHGADASGTADSTAAFVKAIDALGKRGGIVDIPVGRYRIDQAPIRVTTPVHFRGDGGMVRTAVGAGRPQGSVTTLIFPPDRDGFIVVAPSGANAHFEGFALVRTKSDGSPQQRCARRGIYAQSRIWAESLYLVNWQRGIDLDGRKTHPDFPDVREPFSVDQSQVSRIFAEECFWATYTHGLDAQGCHFEHIITLSCEAGIYESSQGGNGYVDCYVDGGLTEPPYYIDDNQSVLLNCRCESRLPPQIGPNVQVVGGAFGVGELPKQVAAALGVVQTPPGGPSSPFRMINGLPARHEGAPFPGGTATFVDGERIDVTIDGVKRTIEFTAGVFTPAQVAEKINAGFVNLKLPRVATANGFANQLTVEGWRGHNTGTVAVDGASATLAKIGFPAAAPTPGKQFGQLLSAPQSSHVVFRGYSGLKSDGTPGANAFGTDQQVEVFMAPDGIRPIFWQARGDNGDAHEFGILRDVRKDAHRWAFARASSPSLIPLAFTVPPDSLGADQAVAYRGIWLQGSSGRRILLSSGVPSNSQGTLEDTQPPTVPHDFAWDMAASPPKRYTRTVTGWVADSASAVHGVGAAQLPPLLNLTLQQLNLQNVEDAAGWWLFEGGEVYEDGSHVANYASTRRAVTGGTETLNAATLTLTLFFLDDSGELAENMTLQGTHRFASSTSIGSVSAVSQAFAARIGTQFKQVGQTLTVQ
ncbi:glycosyl hydrolase family 28-related protein [Streptomyces sp. NPDC056580]|uniref:glycosyl hydrolase family 28-related protein n=1 Tax=Streptomyces sp. NPDC056580 TaxID=3345872 RepID=UPI0036B4635A